ncbi:hypothetical protein ACIRCZ_18680 [Leifsonia sp. NPDC102414]|uniref:hypothetical protein n=1 Tax=Leifsonia sp. NPDC102414 TaxID=3364124 RepID=UPI00381C3CB9
MLVGLIGIASLILWLGVTELRAAARRDDTALAFIRDPADRERLADRTAASFRVNV